jgi:zinc protease
VLTSVLATGDASRLRRRLVQEDRVASDVGAHIAFMEDAFDVRNPTALLVEAHHTAEVPSDRVVAAVDEELDRVATGGVPDDELERVRARLTSALLQGQDHVLSRTLAMASFEQQRGRAELVGELPALLGAVTGEQVAAAAAELLPDTRARLDIVAGGAR